MNTRASIAVGCFLVAACGATTDATSASSSSSSSTSSTSSSSSSGAATTSTVPCKAGATTATTTTAPSGCQVLDRDTSACEAERTAAGLSGVWLKVSCRVTLSMSGGHVLAVTDDQPDYESSYFPTTSACYAAYTGGIHNPNEISAQSWTITFPSAPSGTGGKMTGAVVGMALNGVAIFGDFAAPGDDIYQEAQTFDACGGHPQGSGVYHYHGEPYSLTYDDARLVGIMLDGSPVYGRRDQDGSLPTLDADGGHTSTTADSPSTPVYHYHVNEQISTGARTAGEKQWFLTTGSYHSAPGTCSGAGC